MGGGDERKAGQMTCFFLAPLVRLYANTPSPRLRGFVYGEVSA